MFLVMLVMILESVLWPWRRPSRYHPHGCPGPEGRTIAADSVRIPLTLSGLQYFCCKVNMSSLLASPCQQAVVSPPSHLHRKLRAGKGRQPPARSPSWWSQDNMEPSPAPNPWHEERMSFHSSAKTSRDSLETPWKRPAKWALLLQASEESELWKGSWERKKCIFQQHPQSRSLSASRKCWEKEWDHTPKRLHLPGKKVDDMKWEPPTPTPGLGRAQSRKPAPGGLSAAPTSPTAVHWLSNAPVPCRCGSTSLNTWFTPRWQLKTVGRLQLSVFQHYELLLLFRLNLSKSIITEWVWLAQFSLENY